MGVLELFTGMDFFIIKDICMRSFEFMDGQEWHRLDSFINKDKFEDSLHSEAVGSMAANGIKIAFIRFAEI